MRVGRQQLTGELALALLEFLIRKRRLRGFD
jgi:hypothetical protein